MRFYESVIAYIKIARFLIRARSPMLTSSDVLPVDRWVMWLQLLSLPSSQHLPPTLSILPTDWLTVCDRSRRTAVVRDDPGRRAKAGSWYRPLCGMRRRLRRRAASAITAVLRQTRYSMWVIIRSRRIQHMRDAVCLCYAVNYIILGTA